jgi:multiple sugar transport system ATP-binding protein
MSSESYLLDTAKIEFKNVWKKYGDIVALKGIDYAIQEKEFFIIFGPSGAGKTTTLKIIAGLEYVSAGELKINGEFANFISPQARNVRMAFENYSLYPHLTVFENLASPLRVKKFSLNEIKRRVVAISETLSIGEFLERLPRELSGGQKQRVALGRALIIESDIYLLDEPLAHLDAKIRNELRADFQDIKSYLGGSTVIYVTHDYLEALALGDRICLINNGEVLQIGEPENIYYHPADTFVAQLMGQPEINLLEVTIKRKGNEHYFAKNGFYIKVPKNLKTVLSAYTKDKVILGCRPQFWHFEQKKPMDEAGLLQTVITAFEIRNYKGVILTKTDDFSVTLLCESYEEMREGDNIWIKPDVDRICLFDINTRVNLSSNQ